MMHIHTQLIDLMGDYDTRSVLEEGKHVQQLAQQQRAYVQASESPYQLFESPSDPQGVSDSNVDPGIAVDESRYSLTHDKTHVGEAAYADPHAQSNVVNAKTIAFYQPITRASDIERVPAPDRVVLAAHDIEMYAAASNSARYASVSDVNASAGNAAREHTYMTPSSVLDSV
jgi:hypothetical protein